MIGELDFMDVFFSEDPDEEVIYDGVSYAVFIIFVIFVSIIIMNLLVSPSGRLRYSLYEII